jgi:hypothetical protein
VVFFCLFRLMMMTCCLTSSPSCICVYRWGVGTCVCVQEVRKKSLPFPFTFFLLFRLFRIFVAKQMDCVELQLGRGGIDFFYEKKKYFYIHLNLMKKILVRISWSILFSSSISDVCAAHVDTQRETLSPPSHRNVV